MLPLLYVASPAPSPCPSSAAASSPPDFLSRTPSHLPCAATALFPSAGCWRHAPLSISASARERSSQNTMVYLLGVVASMVAASYAAVPLYRLFCQATGYGGTVQRREIVQYFCKSKNAHKLFLGVRSWDHATWEISNLDEWNLPNS